MTLADRLIDLSARLEGDGSLPAATESLRIRLSRFEWPRLAPVLDEARGANRPR